MKGALYGDFETSRRYDNYAGHARGSGQRSPREKRERNSTAARNLQVAPARYAKGRF